MKKGISLIVLVITIIVMIILAAAVIISMSNTGIIDKANYAVNLADEKQVQDLAALTWAEAYLDETRTETMETVVKRELSEQGITEDKWNITVTDTGVTVTSKEPQTVPVVTKTWRQLIDDGLVQFDEMIGIFELTTTGDERIEVDASGLFAAADIKLINCENVEKITIEVTVANLTMTGCKNLKTIVYLGTMSVFEHMNVTGTGMTGPITVICTDGTKTINL